MVTRWTARTTVKQIVTSPSIYIYFKVRKQAQLFPTWIRVMSLWRTSCYSEVCENWSPKRILHHVYFSRFPQVFTVRYHFACLLELLWQFQKRFYLGLKPYLWHWTFKLFNQFGVFPSSYYVSYSSLRRNFTCSRCAIRHVLLVICNLLDISVLNYHQGCHTVRNSSICPYFEGLCLRKYYCPFF